MNETTVDVTADQYFNAMGRSAAHRWPLTGVTQIFTDWLMEHVGYSDCEPLRHMWPLIDNGYGCSMFSMPPFVVFGFEREPVLRFRFKREADALIFTMWLKDTYGYRQATGHDTGFRPREDVLSKFYNPIGWTWYG